MSSTGFAPAEQPVNPAGDDRQDRHQQLDSESGLAEVVFLSHARELASSSHEVQPELASFAQVVLPLELADGRPLHGAGRGDCERAYETHPAGFTAAIDEAMAARVARHCGLLVKLVRQGYHVSADELARAKQRREIASPDPANEQQPARREQGTCFVCEEKTEVTFQSGQWWCDRHLETE